MGQKCNQRSFRYSDEVAAILLAYGSKNSSVNDKFEQLVLDCNLKVPAIKAEIKREQGRLDKLRTEYRDLQQKVWNLQRYEREMNELHGAMMRLKISLVDAADKCNTNSAEGTGAFSKK